MPRFRVSFRGNRLTADANQRADACGQPTPQLSIVNTQMSLVAPKNFVRPLPDQGDFHVLAGALADKIHRNDGRRSDRLFQTGHNFRKDLSNSSRSSFTGI